MGALLITGLCIMLATAPPAGGPTRTGPLTVMEDAISLEHGADGLVLKLPVHTNALALTVTLKATVALMDADGKVRAEQENLSTVDTGPATVGVTLDIPPDTEDLRELRLDYRVRCLHPPAEVRGAVDVSDVMARLDGGPARSGVVVVLEESIEIEHTDETVEVSLPVRVNALAPSVTLNVLTELIDPTEEPRARSEITHTMPTGPATVGVTLKTEVTAEELRTFRLRYRVKTLYPPAEVGGEVPVDGLVSQLSGGMPRPGVLRVLKEAVSLRRVDAGLEVAIPVHTHALARSVTVKVTAELLDVNDTIVAATESSSSMPPGPGTVAAVLPITAETTDLLPLRLRYRVRSLQPPGEEIGMIAVSELMAVPEIIFMGEDTYLSGSRASVRILALDHSSMLPLEGSTVRATLTGDQGKIMPLFEERVDEAGTVEPVLELPAGLEGSYTLRVEAETPLGSQELERTISVEARSLPLLVTDKPTYQPGQTVFARILCLRRPTREAMAGAQAELSIEDPKGNVVFRKDLVLDRMGVGASEFHLADYVTLGRYIVKAAVGRESVEKTVQVERYVLPKFDIELTADRSHYQPGQELRGELDATYFFGKPVAGGRLIVTLRKFDVGPEVFQEIRGTLDENGTFTFAAQLPTYFVGIPLEQGDAYVELEVSVTDGADHEERARRTYPVTKAPLVLRVLPESGELVAGIANRIHVAVSYPDGRPVSGTVSVVAGEERFWVETDELGLASFEVTVEPNTSVPLVLLATDQEGQKAGAEYVLSPSSLEAALLLRPALNLAAVGEPLTFHLLSTAPARVAYVDLIKDGQTVLTRSVPMDAGRGVLELVPGADLAGTVWAHAYQVVSTGDIIRDTRVVYVDPASDLTVGVAADEDRYAPGSAGRITFSVLDAAGDPAQAALGVTVVDQAVFARTEMRPGMEKVYFMLEDEIMEPRFEIHGFETPVLVMGRPPVDDAQRSLWHKRERAAEVLFASLPGPGGHAVEINTFRAAMEALRGVFLERMDRDWQEIWRARQEHMRSRRRMPTDIAELVAGGFLDPAVALDMWAKPYAWSADDEGPWFELQSAGPDGVWGTDDDLACEGEQRARRRFKVMGQVVGAIPKAPGALDQLSIEEFKAAPEDVGAVPVEEPRVREYFPETMLFEPMLITDSGGRATLDVRWPDSITEWRLTTTASTAKGELGSDVRGIEVFQPFFVDLDLPVALTQGDEVWIPVAVYNYLEGEQKVRLEMPEDDWFELLGEATKEKLMAPGEVDFVRFHLKAISLGSHTLSVKAYGADAADAVSRIVTVVPDGRKHVDTYSDRLTHETLRTVEFPAHAVEGANALLLRVLPGVMSQVVEGLQSIFRMPFGCFEQTSSITYPNVMVLDYMRTTGNVSPELEMTAEEYINLGYQRLLAYEVEGGASSGSGIRPRTSCSPPTASWSSTTCRACTRLTTGYCSERRTGYFQSNTRTVTGHLIRSSCTRNRGGRSNGRSFSRPRTLCGRCSGPVTRVSRSGRPLSTSSAT